MHPQVPEAPKERRRAAGNLDFSPVCRRRLRTPPGAAMDWFRPRSSISPDGKALQLVERAAIEAATRNMLRPGLLGTSSPSRGPREATCGTCCSIRKPWCSLDYKIHGGHFRPVAWGLFPAPVEVERIGDMLQLHNNHSLNAAMQKLQGSGSAHGKALKALWEMIAGGAFRDPQFARFFVGVFFAVQAIWVQRVTLAWLAWERTGEARRDSSGWSPALGLAPTLVAGPLFGVMADQGDIRRAAARHGTGSWPGSSRCWPCSLPLVGAWAWRRPRWPSGSPPRHITRCACRWVRGSWRARWCSTWFPVTALKLQPRPAGGAGDCRLDHRKRRGRAWRSGWPSCATCRCWRSCRFCALRRSCPRRARCPVPSRSCAAACEFRGRRAADPRGADPDAGLRHAPCVARWEVLPVLADGAFGQGAAGLGMLTSGGGGGRPGLGHAQGLGRGARPGASIPRSVLAANGARFRGPRSRAWVSHRSGRSRCWPRRWRGSRPHGAEGQPAGGDPDRSARCLSAGGS